MRRTLQTRISLTIALAVLFTVSLISFLSNWLIHAEFERYIRKKQAFAAEQIVNNISHQYHPQTQGWDAEFIHGVGMYALSDGYVIKLYDARGSMVWDAENHDMRLCAQIMSDTARRMAEHRPDVNGRIAAADYTLTQGGKTIGSLTIVSYGPFFFSENDFRFLEALNVMLMAIGIAALVCAVAAGCVLAGRISRPVVKAAGIAQEISAGNYGIRLAPETGTRELDGLAQAMNHLADTLEQQESLRKRLTSDVAHELRTPLTGVAAQLEAMIEGVWEATPARLQGCYEETLRISGLVADLERLAVTESAQLRLQKTQVDLLALAQTACSRFESLPKKIALRAEGQRALVPADPDRLLQVMLNLLSNAIKYTPENGHVRITVQDTAQAGIFAVEDDGIGIAAHDLPLIFERFYRTDQSRSRATGGAGIGLSIVHALVSAHGGSIRAQSSPGQGSRFEVTIPKH